MVDEKLREDEYKCYRCGRILKKGKKCMCFRKRKKKVEKHGGITFIDYEPDYDESGENGSVW